MSYSYQGQLASDITLASLARAFALDGIEIMTVLSMLPAKVHPAWLDPSIGLTKVKEKLSVEKAAKIALETAKKISEIWAITEAREEQSNVYIVKIISAAGAIDFDDFDVIVGKTNPYKDFLCDAKRSDFIKFIIEGFMRSLIVSKEDSVRLLYGVGYKVHPKKCSPDLNSAVVKNILAKGRHLGSIHKHGSNADTSRMQRTESICDKARSEIIESSSTKRFTQREFTERVKADMFGEAPHQETVRRFWKDIPDKFKHKGRPSK